MVLNGEVASVKLALLGDRDDGVIAHRALPVAVQLAAAAEGAVVSVEWVHSRRLVRPLPELGDFDGAWCVPASALLRVMVR